MFKHDINHSFSTYVYVIFGYVRSVKLYQDKHLPKSLIKWLSKNQEEKRSPGVLPHQIHNQIKLIILDKLS